MEKLCMVYITAADTAEGELISKELVNGKFAACCNMIKDIRSFYSWEGKSCDEREVLLILKTRERLLEKIEKKLKEIHSYECPCMAAYPIVYCPGDFRAWIIENTMDTDGF